MIISTVSWKRRLYRMVGWWLTFIILLAAATAVFADKPPDALFRHVTTTAQLVHRGECDVKSLKVKDTTCLIFYNGKDDVVWVVLFDHDKNGNPAVTHVVSATNKKEKLVWCRQDVCV